MDTEALKRAMEKADSEILDVFTVKPQCGIRILEEEYQHALNAVQKNDKINRKGKTQKEASYGPDTRPIEE